MHLRFDPRIGPVQHLKDRHVRPDQPQHAGDGRGGKVRVIFCGVDFVNGVEKLAPGIGVDHHRRQQDDLDA